MAARFLSDRQFARPPGFRFQFRSQAGEIRVRATDGKDVVDIPVEWAFGAGEQAVTFVTRVNEEWYLEHYLSYYSALQSFAHTPGQEAVSANSLQHAMGTLYQVLDPDLGIKACFECHSTGPVSFGPTRQVRPAEPGVRCEACHGPGNAHGAAAFGGDKERARKLIGNPGHLSSAEVNRVCGNCHRQPAPPGVATDWDVAWNVRHQPVYLSQSACFRKSGGALSCLTCHSAHDRRERTDAAYNERCRSCHNSTSHRPKPICLAAQRANCVGCHMPRVSPQAYLGFTNHWIGVYAEGAKLKPMQR